MLRAARLQLGDLLLLEKQRRHLRPEQLVFVGTRNLAQYHWCGMQSVLTSRARELMFFFVYLTDRVEAAIQSNRVRQVPARLEELLTLGADISLTEMNDRYLARYNLPFPECPSIPIPDDQLENFYDAPSDPVGYGIWAEQIRAEQYPSLRWNFEWERYVFVGIPDGLTKDFVYEYKTTSSEFLFGFSLPCALAQADLYGLFFQRPRKRVQMYIKEQRRTVTRDEPVDLANALKTLQGFKSLDEGLPATPPQARWKCRRCEVNMHCSIRHP